MIKLKITALFIVGLFVAVGAQESGGKVDDLARQPFYLDYAAFRDSSSSNIILEVYYKIFSGDLAYKKWGDKYKADYSVDITLDHNGKQVTGVSKDGSVIADNYKQTQAQQDYVINRLIFKVPPDDYELSAHLNNPASGEITNIKLDDLKFKNFLEEPLSLSSPEIVREAREAKGDSDFVRSNLVLIPSVSRVFGEDDPELIVYYEIYDSLDFKGDYQAVYEIRQDAKKIMTDTARFSSAGARTVRDDRFQVNNFEPGEYTLNVKVQEPDGKEEAKTSADFLIGWSVMSIVKNDWKTAVSQLRYIASANEMKKLQKIKPEERLKSWEDFWKSKDPTPSTAENEMKDEYYRRIRYSDLNFGNFGKDGWKTDMGMVYVRYGPPDEIERHPFDIDARPYQIWYYYSTRRTFTFVDAKGYGDYELAYPYDGDLGKVR